MTGIYNELLKNAIKWAVEKEDLTSLMLGGSQAYKDERAKDSWSDLDLAFCSSDPGFYYHNPGTLREIYPIKLFFQTDFFGIKELPVFRVQFENHLEADISIYSEEMLAPEFPQNSPENLPFRILFMAHSGCKVLIDKKGKLQKWLDYILTIPLPEVKPIKENELNERLKEFSVSLIHTCKKLKRGDRFYVYRETASYLWDQLENLILLYLEAKQGRIMLPKDNLKNFHIWGKDPLLKGIEVLFPSSETISLWSSLYAMLDYMERINQAMAEQAGFQLNREILKFTREELDYFHSS